MTINYGGNRTATQQGANLPDIGMPSNIGAYQLISQSMQNLSKEIVDSVQKARDLKIKAQDRQNQLTMISANSHTPESILEGKPMFDVGPMGEVLVRQPEQQDIDEALYQQQQKMAALKISQMPVLDDQISALTASMKALYPDIADPEGLARGAVKGGPGAANLITSGLAQREIGKRTDREIAGKEVVAGIKADADLTKQNQKFAFQQAQADQKFDQELTKLGYTYNLKEGLVGLEATKKKEYLDYAQSKGVSASKIAELIVELDQNPYFLKSLNKQRAIQGLDPYETIDDYMKDVVNSSNKKGGVTAPNAGDFKDAKDAIK